MPYIADWKSSDPFQVLVYGQAKVGKTWGALTFPRPVVFDFDSGIATARNPEFVKAFGLRNTFYEVFQDADRSKGVVVTHNAFDDACRFFDEWMKPDGKWKGTPVGRDRFDTWIIDSGTSLSEFAQNKAIIIMQGMKLSKTHEMALAHGLVVPKIQDYGSERSLVEQFIDMIKSSGKHVVLLCHEKEMTNDTGTVIGIVPLLTGRSSEVVPMKFDEVFNLRIKRSGPDVVRYLQTMPDGLRKVGTRYGIPNESPWNWDSLKAELERIKALQVGQTSPHKE